MERLIQLHNTARQLHYARNRFNTNLPSSENEAIDNNHNWRKLSFIQNIFHQNTASLFSPNIKYISSDGHKEIIFNSSGLEVTDSRDMGTYNFFDPESEASAHIRYDVDPYYEWGNVPK